MLEFVALLVLLNGIPYWCGGGYLLWSLATGRFRQDRLRLSTRAINAAPYAFLVCGLCVGLGQFLGSSQAEDVAVEEGMRGTEEANAFFAFVFAALPFVIMRSRRASRAVPTRFPPR